MGRIQNPVEVQGVQAILDEGLEVHEMSIRDLLQEILYELKHLNKHLFVVTEEELEANDY